MTSGQPRPSLTEMWNRLDPAMTEAVRRAAWHTLTAVDASHG
jgi:hypothetical protein